MLESHGNVGSSRGCAADTFAFDRSPDPPNILEAVPKDYILAPRFDADA